MPVMKLVPLTTAYYSRRSVGVTRLYAAASANRKLDKLVRCYFTDIPLNGKYVALEDGLQYRIDAVQEVVGQDACDLTLVRLEDRYDVWGG